MKRLLTEFTKLGWQFTQISRNGNVAIYRKKRIGGNAVSFEVVIVQSHDGFKVPKKEGGKKDIPPSEFYPSSAQWGTLGWSYETLTSAQQKAASLLSDNKNAENQEALP